MDIISDKNKKNQHKKELNSLRNKMGVNLAWFDSLGTTQKYNLLFEWKAEKYSNKLTEPKKIMVNNPYLRRWVETTIYPISFKHFINSRKSLYKYKINVVNLRDATIDIILKNKNK